MRVLFLGDIVGRPGRRAVADHLSRIRRELGAQLVVANAENASGGLGVKPDAVRLLLSSGVDVVTTGNHVWRFAEIQSYLERETRLLRPANFAPGLPGRGLGLYTAGDGERYAVLNLQGRTYMEPIDCPFRKADELLAQIPPDVRLILADFHAEATSEKIAMGYHLRGRVGAVFGTHTHVQTADARILGGHTAVITDAGMCGPRDSVLGMEPETILARFTRGLPVRFRIARGEVRLCGALLELDASTGGARSISSWSRDL